MTFDGLRHQLAAFAMSANEVEANISVRLTLIDGSIIRLKDIVFSEPFNASDWTMLRSRNAIHQAVVIREEQVIRVDLEIPEVITVKPIGFSAEE